ncbi:wd repeat protein [Ophiostoma piceae UAMH 11346]|uniref:Wd repeat protein n=1 Tax=Ophiostoma piceae (strain UAMH 11346) TaxID=1262450 RepID=S3CB10_OPHP1|nr:wd repeat protein [Ophiostoma piceae UAMH 11346]
MSHRLYQTRPPLCPVTALAFYQYGLQPLVLAGEGGWLAIYEATEDVDITAGSQHALLTGRRCLGRIRIFTEQAMQGLRVGGDSNGSVLVWGGQSVALVTREHIARTLSAHGQDPRDSAATVSVNEVIAPDWIYDGLLPCAGGRGALITAHNEILSFKISDTEAVPTLALVGSSISPSRPMLYSAQLAWVDGNNGSSTDEMPEHLLVAAGTVFGEIVVWTCQPASEEPSIKVLQVFTGHEGSIFDVVVSPEINLGRQRKARLLASCSDDRTIRIWPLYLDAEPSSDQTEPDSLQTTANVARETGFQNTFDGLAHRSNDHAKPETMPRQVTRTKNTYLQNNIPSPQSSPTATSPIATVMAHASRIWHVRFGEVAPVEAAKDQQSSVHVYSFGEDASAQEWRLELDSTGQDLCAELVHLRTLSLHSGKNIWSAAVFTSTTSSGALIATGGSDGKICLFQGRQSGQPHIERLSEVVVSCTVPLNPNPPATPDAIPAPAVDEQVFGTENSGEETSKPKKKKKLTQTKVREEIFNSYAFLSDDQLLSATSHGRLLLGKFREGANGLSTLSSIEWTELPDVPELISHSLKDYNVVRSPRGGGGGGIAAIRGVEGLACLGSASGQLFIYSSASGKVHELDTKLPGKVDEIFFLPSTRKESSEVPMGSSIQLELIATTLFRDEAVLLGINIDTATGTVLSSRSERTLKLPKKAPTSPTAMTITAASRCQDYIVLGSRNGQLCLYKPTGDSADAEVFDLETQLQTRTKDAILSIVPLPPRTGHPPLSSSSFVVTARDGTYRIYCVEQAAAPEGASTPCTAQITLQHETATPFGPIVRDAWFVDSQTLGEPPELVICGFRSTNFVVWNETRQQEIATVDCGGTHRTHTYLYCGGASAEKVRFAFTRNSELHFFAQNTCAASPLKRGGHGREIRAVSASASGTYVATGGEDTVVRIWSSGDDQAGAAGDRRCLSVLKLHNTGLHNLVWLGDSCLISAAGSEELFIWRITTICDSAYDGLAVLCESSYPDSTTDKVLRIIGLDATLNESPEKQDAESMFISVGISNSVIKTYCYTTSTDRGASGTWQLVSQGQYTGACPTQVRHLRMGQDSGLVVLAAFADGHLTVWRAARDLLQRQYRDYTLACATKAHQNAVKALDLLFHQPWSTLGQSKAHLTLFTGGDDNSIAVTTLSWAETGEASTQPLYSFSKTFRVSGAHAASVNGAKILESSTTCTVDNLDYSSFTAVTCSNDQRVKAWRVLMAEEESTGRPVRIQLLDNSYSAIADPGDIERIVGQDKSSCGAIVVGMGMEAWSLQ